MNYVAFSCDRFSFEGLNASYRRRTGSSGSACICNLCGEALDADVHAAPAGIQTAAIDRAESAIATLARNGGRTLQRLRPVIQLAISSAALRKPSVVDVGTDHGLVAIGLAVSGCFSRVIGVDISRDALRNGAITLEKSIIHFRRKHGRAHETVPWEFRLSNGVEKVSPGEADMILIAGMGVNTILQIVNSTVNLSPDSPPQTRLDFLNCTRLVMQPTNSRPRNMMRLYTHLNKLGWCLLDECIDLVDGRWYISVVFGRDQPTNWLPGLVPFPGGKLISTDTKDFKRPQEDFLAYVKHHRTWIHRNQDVSGKIHPDETAWLRFVHDFANHQ